MPVVGNQADPILLLPFDDGSGALLTYLKNQTTKGNSDSESDASHSVKFIHTLQNESGMHRKLGALGVRLIRRPDAIDSATTNTNTNTNTNINANEIENVQKWKIERIEKEI